MILTVVGVTGSMSGPASPASCYLLQAEGTDSLGLPHTYSVGFDLGPGSFGQIWNYTDRQNWTRWYSLTCMRITAQI